MEKMVKLAVRASYSFYTSKKPVTKPIIFGLYAYVSIPGLRHTSMTCYTTAPTYCIIISVATVVGQRRNVKHEK